MAECRLNRLVSRAIFPIGAAPCVVAMQKSTSLLSRVSAARRDSALSSLKKAASWAATTSRIANETLPDEFVVFRNSRGDRAKEAGPCHAKTPLQLKLCEKPVVLSSCHNRSL